MVDSLRRVRRRFTPLETVPDGYAGISFAGELSAAAEQALSRRFGRGSVQEAKPLVIAPDGRTTLDETIRVFKEGREVVREAGTAVPVVIIPDALDMSSFQYMFRANYRPDVRVFRPRDLEVSL